MTSVHITSDEVPTREDGSPFPYAFIAGDGATLFAETLSEIVDELIEGYSELPPMTDDFDAHLDARLGNLAYYAAQAQAGVVASLESSGAFTVETLSEDTLTALFTPKDGAILEFEEWTESIPLILFTTNYAPFSDIPAPTGEGIVWVNPYTELTYLQSFSALGAGELHVQEAAE